MGGRLEEGMDRVATDRDEPKDKDDIGVVITNGYKAIRSKTSNEFIALIDLNQGAEVAALKPLCFSRRFLEVYVLLLCHWFSSSIWIAIEIFFFFFFFLYFHTAAGRYGA